MGAGQRHLANRFNTYIALSPVLRVESDYLLRKLEPLIPEKVQHWRRAKQVADPETKVWLDRVIGEAAYRVLGEFTNKLLLSLPPKERARGSFHVGTILYDKPRWEFGISSGELLQNMAIFGRSGSGKTNTVFHILKQISDRKVPWLFWDWKRTARHLIPQIKGDVKVFTPGRSLSPFVFNPFIVPPGMESNVYITQLVDIMASAFTLGDGSRSILQKSIAACYDRGIEAPTIEDIKVEVEKIPDKQRVTGWKLSAMRALDSLAFSRVAGTTRLTQEEHTKALLESQTIIELDALADSIKQFLVPILSLWLYSVRLASETREKLSLVIILEEAHNVLFRGEQRSKETVMNRLLRQCREIGIGIIVVDQSPHLISSVALGNTYTSIILNLKDPSDINRAASLSHLTEYEKGHLTLLPLGVGVVKLQDRWRRPILVKIPLVDVAKGAVTDDLLKRYLNRTLKQKELRVEVLKKRTKSLNEGDDRLLTLDEFRLFHDVLQNPDDGVAARYQRLELSGRRGQEAKEALVNHGWLEEQLHEQGRIRRILLTAPPKAAKLLGPDLKDIPANAIVHKYWKGHYGRMFEDKGYDISFEQPRANGWVDVLATRNGRRIGIEIETGKSDVVANVKNGILSKFTKILVVATDEEAMAKVERQLAQAGLLIPNQVELVLRDDYMPPD